jgi:hypothetical protein
MPIWRCVAPPGERLIFAASQNISAVSAEKVVRLPAESRSMSDAVSGSTRMLFTALPISIPPWFSSRWVLAIVFSENIGCRRTLS